VLTIISLWFKLGLWLGCGVPWHGRALIKSFLSYKRTMEDNMAIWQVAWSYPKATCYPAKEEIVDIDIEFDIVALKVRLSMWQQPLQLKEPPIGPALPFAPWSLSSFSSVNQLKLVQTPLSRLKVQLALESSLALLKSEMDQILLEGSGQQTLVALDSKHWMLLCLPTLHALHSTPQLWLWILQIWMLQTLL